MATEALYYPWIDIRDETWLKTSVLYWDSLRTIVPESVKAPYSSKTALALQEAGFLVPLRVHSRMDEIHELTDDALTYLTSTEGAELLATAEGGRHHRIHVDKLSTTLRRLPMHVDKFGHEVLHFVSGLAPSSRSRSSWLYADAGFALFYMTLLASRLADRVGAAPVTPLATADRLAIAARLDTRLNRLFPTGLHGPDPRWAPLREYGALGPRRPLPRSLAPGLLAQLALERLAIDAETSVDRLLDFRETYRDALAAFRTKIAQLASAVEGDLPAEALRQRLVDFHRNEVEPAIAALKAALRARRIRWLGDGLLKTAFLSVGPSAMLTLTGLDMPTALLAGAGLSFVVSGLIYNVDKEEYLRTQPYSYVLAAEREFQTKGPHNKRLRPTKARRRTKARRSGK